MYFYKIDLRRRELLKLQAGVLVWAWRDLSKFRAGLAGEVMPTKHAAIPAQREPFAIPAAGKKRQGRNSKERGDMNRASVHGENFLASRDLLAQFVK